jgi:chromosomal replication initiation ATPase DnaA
MSTRRDHQLAFELGHVASQRPEDFLPAPSNEAALAWIERWPDWPAPALAVYGPAGCGKSHLASIWRARSQAIPLSPSGLHDEELAAWLQPGQAVLLDLGEWPIERDRLSLDETALFHLLNWLAQESGSLLICARVPPARWPVALADLRSRLAAIPAVEIAAPDEPLLAALLVKLFADRQLPVPAEVVQFLVSRMERSCEAAGRLVAALDRAALAAHRRVTIPLAQAVLDESDSR